MTGDSGQPRQPVTPDPDTSIHGRMPPEESGIAIPTREERRPPIPGQAGVVMLGLSLGILLMGLQLWLLTLAFDLYRSGATGDLVTITFWSGLVFVGGLIMLRLLDRGPTRTG